MSIPETEHSNLNTKKYHFPLNTQTLDEK